jgi:hypothetical protein
MRWWTVHSDQPPAPGFFGRLRRLYQRRIVNVNVNVIAAGAIALLPTMLAAHGARSVFGADAYLLITGVTFAADAVSDVAAYYVLHWVANNMRGSASRANRSPAYGHLPFLKDATLVQFERMCISPLLYGIALSTQYLMMRVSHAPPAWATVVGFAAGIGVTRVIHTLWMWRAERKAAAKLRESGVLPSTAND